MTLRRASSVILVTLASVALVACNSIHLPWQQERNHGHASPGERISLLELSDQLRVADSLRGQDFFLPPPAPQADWPVAGGTLEQSVEHVDAAPNFQLAWRTSFGRGSNKRVHVMAPPIMADGKVFLMDAMAEVSAHDAHTGATLWRANLMPKSKRDHEAFGGGLAFSGGKLYAASGFRVVAQLDPGTGHVDWSTRTDAPLHAAPTVADGRVFVVDVNDQLLTFDSTTGAPDWNYQALTEPARILAASSPAVSGDTVVASFGSGELVALRIANGNDLWSEALSRASRTSALSEIRDIPGRPAIYQGDVFAVSHSGVFSATDLRTGQARWSLPVVGITSPLPAGDVVYVVSKNGEVICAARETGLIYWIRDLNAGRKFKKTGGLMGLGGKRVIKPGWSSPLLVNNRVLVAGSTGELYAINAKTGAVERTVKLGDPTLIGPIAMGGMVYVVTDKAELIALR